MVVMGIILVYTLGHFVAMFGQIIFDRILLDEIIQHPIFTLLNIQKGEREYSIAIFQSLFILYNLLLLINILNININASVFGSELQLLDLVILAIMITLIVIKVGVMVYRFKPENREKLVKRGLPKWIEKPTLFLKRKIFNMFNSSFKKLLGLDRPFPDEFIQKHKINFKNYFGLNSDEMGYENYWLSFFYTSSRNPVATVQIKNWLQIYSFARNTSAAAYLTLTIITITIMLNNSAYNSNVKLFGLILFMIAFILMLRYWYLYQNYFIKNIIRSFVEGTSNNQKI
jgi:hypothetical protein